MYKTGGLEVEEHNEVLEIDGVKYVVSNKFKSMLRDNFVDWGAFLEIYDKTLDDSIMFEQIVKLLNIKDNSNIRDAMLPLIKKIYQLPASSHMASMLKQFMIYEPVSAAIHNLFMVIKNHYERIVEKYIIVRNRYIQEKQLNDKLNDFPKLIEYWQETNIHYALDTSSLILKFLNPPKGILSKLNIGVKNVTETEELKYAIKHFKYEGFCHKVPQERLYSLLKFPINAFIKAIKVLDKSVKFPNYSKIEQYTNDKLSLLPAKPEIPNDYIRKQPPTTLNVLDTIKWYVDEILELRKSLLPYGKKFEEYYIKHASILNEIAIEVKKEFAIL